MSANQVAIGFSNCLGNFILMTAALKILRKRSKDKIYLITDKDILHKFPAVKGMAEKLFDGIYTTYKKNAFDRIYVGDWSCPECMVEAKDAHRGPVWWINHSSYAGMHEVQVYLNMIDAVNSDFSGFLPVTANRPILSSSRPKIALANSSVRVGSRKGSKTGWSRFPELSRALTTLGYEVILVGQGEELRGCEGVNFVDKLDIFETSKVISQCDLIVSVDTGLMHVADSLGVPIILLVGPTPVTKAHPLVSSYQVVRKFVSCAPCYQSVLWHNCNKSLCMDAITVDDVLKRIFLHSFKIDTISRTPLPPFINKVLLIPHKGKKNLKVVMPYYSGSSRIDNAVTSWPKDVLILAVTDEGTKVPDGYDSFFTPDNAKVRGLSDKTKPITKDLYNRLLEIYPDKDFYGYVNSDIILPSNVDVQSLLPGYGYQVALHHRLDVHDCTNSTKSTMSYWSGKDCFIWSATTFKKVASDYPELVIGACNWDDGLAHWMWREFGKDSIDVRYGEIWHVVHPPGWTGKHNDGRYNGATLDSIGISTQLRSQFPWKQWYQRWTLVRNKIGIVQPGRIGDIIIVLPIAKWYADKGYEVIWPVCDKYLPLFEHINYVQPVGVGVDIGKSYAKSVDMLKDKVGRVINLGIGFGRNEDDWLKSELTFDQWKYEEAGVPFNEKYNLQITRHHDKEEALKKKLGLSSGYVVTHSKGESAGSCVFNFPNTVDVQPINGHCLFDWIGILESAREFHCINSCVMNLMDGLKIGRHKRHVKLWDLKCDPSRAKLLVPKIEPDWYEQDTQLPVAFFTIVLDGMPFIEYHLERFKQLPFLWHWYIVEGLAQIAGDSGAKGHEARGGHLPENREGYLSTDGTREYLDKLTPLSNVTVYRSNDIWPSKLAMVNTPLLHIDYECVLWEIDADEFYPIPSMIELYNMFVANPKKTVAIIPHIAFMSKTKHVVHNKSGWGSDSFPRPWRYKPGYTWKSHEPPVLVNTIGQSLLQVNPFQGNEVAHLGYHHYGYVHSNQIKFKESYYGYDGLYEGWLRMKNTVGKVSVYDFFKFDAAKGAFADDWKGEHLISMDW